MDHELGGIRKLYGPERPGEAEVAGPPRNTLLLPMEYLSTFTMTSLSELSLLFSSSCLTVDS